MPVLTNAERRLLETACINARNLATNGAVNALKTLAVDQAEPFANLDEKQRELRRALRTKGRLEGDMLQEDGIQQIERLASALAYEYWHQMLFARFLAENDLLLHPQFGASVSLTEVEELYPAEGYSNLWQAASAYASKMLPQIFRPGDPLLQVPFAPEDRQPLEALLREMPIPIFTAEDSLGWVYQFWQSAEKDRNDIDEIKINGERLPAKTQLFTEPYMVAFMLQNTIGAWWASQNLGRNLPISMPYLRFNTNGTPAAGRFEGWPAKSAELKILDPSMGSGHFLAALLQLLVTLRQVEEGTDITTTLQNVLSQNLNGLELDPRCTQIAAFNLALTAWKLNGAWMELPPLNLACSGSGLPKKRKDWVDVAGQNPKLRLLFNRLYDIWSDAGWKGSLTKPEGVFMGSEFKEIRPMLPELLNNLELEQADAVEGAVAARGLLKATELLMARYHLVITNPPYLGRGKMDYELSNYCEQTYKNSKADLANVFLDRCLLLCERGGSVTFVMPQNWLFLTSYKNQRSSLLTTKTWNYVVRLGSGAFREITGEVVKAIIISIINSQPSEDHKLSGLDVSEEKNPDQKANALLSKELMLLTQKEQLKNPDAKFVMSIGSEFVRLSKYGNAYAGIQTGDFELFGRNFWEVELSSDWAYESTTVSSCEHFGGKELVIFWQDFKGILAERQKKGMSYVRGWSAFGKKGILISPTGNLNPTLYIGELFDNNSAVIVPEKKEYLAAIWCFCSSKEYSIEVRKLDQKLNVTNATLTQVPFDFNYWQKVADEKYPKGLPQPYSNAPTQWLFHGHPNHSEASLQVALARLLRYHWPAETDTEMELDSKAREHISNIKVFDHLSDADGIVCLVGVNDEHPAHERLRDYIRTVWGDSYQNDTIEQLLSQLGGKSRTLEAWLRDEFFEQHCRLFHHRPFIWQIWDGHKQGFSALVNYHTFNQEKLSRLIYTYLGKWITQCERADQARESGAEARLAAANSLKEKLLLILEGENPYDIFIRWKTLSEQPIGWNPDLNDGVRLNIRPFLQAGVLRWKPNIGKFNKQTGLLELGIDRGNNPPSAPWGIQRNNDLHLSLEEKRASRHKK